MKNRLSFRILSLLFAFVLLVTALPLGVFANDTASVSGAEAASSVESVAADGVSLLPTGYEPEPFFVTEVTELRTENVKHFDNGDGTYEAVSYGTAVHRKDVNGEWQDIDNTLTLREDRGVERYVSSDARISFAPAASGDGAIWSLSENGYSVSLSLSDANLRAGTGADVRNHATRAEQVAAAKKADDREAVLRVDNSTSIVYRNVLANVDLEYVLSGNDVKETILVQNVCENYDYSFKFSLSGLIPKETEYGAILLCDVENGEEVYVIPVPSMTDAKYEYSDAVSYRLTDLGKGEYEIVVSASDEWINDPERAFPVAIDPTVTSPGNYTADTYVNSATGYVDQNNGDKQFAWISDEKTTLIRSFSMPEIPPGATIIDGRLKFAYYFADGATTGSMTVTAHRATRDWVEKDPNGVTWNSLSLNGTDPTLGLTSSIASAELVAASSYPQWAEICITDAVQFWYNGSHLAIAYNYGIGLKRSSGKTLVNLRTNEYNSAAYAPYFTVTYRLFNGIYSIRRMGTTYYLTTDAQVSVDSLYQWTLSSPPNSEALRAYLFKFVYRSATDDFVIRSMFNNQLFLYHDVDNHTVKVGPVSVNGSPATDANLPAQYGWKIGVAPGGYDNHIWATYAGQNYYLCSSATGNGIAPTLSTSPAGYSTEWEFCGITCGSIRGVFSVQSVSFMVPGETIDFDFYSYDDRIGVNGPVSYSVTDLNGNSTNVATVNASTGVCTANSVGYFYLNVTYPNFPSPPYQQQIKVEQSYVGTYFIQNREQELYLQIDNDDAPNYSNNGGIMEIFPLDGENYQRWVFTYVGTGYYKITSPVSGFAITVPTGYENNTDVSLVLTPYTGSDNQKWCITSTTGEGVKIKAKSSFGNTTYDLVMDLETLGDNQPIAGLKVQQRIYIDNSSYNDEWLIKHSIYLEPQEQENWCWAASARMSSMMNNTLPSADQTSLALRLFCPNATLPPSSEQLAQANKTASVPQTVDSLEYLLDYSVDCYGVLGEVYSESVLRSLLDSNNSNNPIIIGFGYYIVNTITNQIVERVGGHMVVVYDYHWVETEEVYVYDIFDPFPVNVGQTYSNSYQDISTRIVDVQNNLALVSLWEACVLRSVGDYSNTIPTQVTLTQ